MEPLVNKNQPTNLNYAIPNKFVLNFARLPNFSFFSQTVVLPSLASEEVTRETPFSAHFMPGDKLQYDALTCTFIMDEELQAWSEIHDWMRGYTFPTDFSEYRELKNQNKFTRGLAKPQYSDGEFIAFSNAFTPLYKFKFYNCFPTMLGSINFSTSDGPDTVLIADVTFRYDYFDKVPV